MIQGQHNAQAGEQAGKYVANGSAYTHRMTAFFTGDAHDAAHSLNNYVISGFFGVGARTAEAGAGCIDQAGVDFFQDIPAQTEFFHGAGAVVFYNYVSLFNHFFEDFAMFRILEVQGHGAFVAVQAHEVSGFGAQERGESAGVITYFRRLDFDYVGAEVSHHHSAVRTSQYAGQIKNFNTF